MLAMPLVFGLLIPKEIQDRDLDRIKLLFIDSAIETEDLDAYDQEDLQYALKREYNKVLLGSWENIKTLCSTMCTIVIKENPYSLEREDSPAYLVRLLGELIQIVQSRAAVEKAKSKGYTITDLSHLVKAIKYTRLGAYQMDHKRFGPHTLECILVSGYVLGIMGCTNEF